MKPLVHSHSSLKEYKTCPLMFYHKRVLKDIPDVKGDAAVWGDRVHKDFESRVRDGVALPSHLAHFEPHLHKIALLETKCEWKVALNKDLKPTTFFASDAFIRGVLDLYASVGGAAAVLIDYKTGKMRDETDQLELGALFAFAHDKDLDEVRCAYFWTQAKMLSPLTIKREEAPDLWAKHLKVTKEIDKSLETGKWKAKPSGLCNYCGFKPHCKASR